MTGGVGGGVEAHDGQQLAHPRRDTRRLPPFEPRYEPHVPRHREMREQSHFLDDVPDAASQAGGGHIAGALSGDSHLAGADGERHVLHEDTSLSRFPFPLSRQFITEPLDLERRGHAAEASAMRNRWSSLVACQRTVSPASERIPRKVSGAYLYE